MGERVGRGCAEGRLKSYLGHDGENNDYVYVAISVSEGRIS